MARIVGVAEELGVPMVARGSPVGSLLVHLLGASPIDPLAHGLLFERFLHAKESPQDVPLDLPSDRRDEVVARVIEALGPGRAALAGAHHPAPVDAHPFLEENRARASPEGRRAGVSP